VLCDSLRDHTGQDPVLRFSLSEDSQPKCQMNLDDDVLLDFVRAVIEGG